MTEPLPTGDDRKGLMFYEAAEGGAGVLTRLASEPQSLAQVADAALRLMHHNQPTGAWSLEALSALEQRDPQGNSVCEAGCYQCLLSYFNQPDHDNINRRNPDALNLLVALANAEMTHAGVPETVLVTGSPESTSGPGIDAWLNALKQAGLRQPDAIQVPVIRGSAIAAAQYKNGRALVFLQPQPDDIRDKLVDKGWRVLDFSDPGQWTAQFALYPEVFGETEKHQ